MSTAHWLKTATLVLAWGAASKTTTAADIPVHRVTSVTLDVTVMERGVVEASLSENAYCRVEGETTIVWILPEGSLVIKGQLICELDPSPVRDQLAEKTFAVRRADADHQNARLTREVAEIAVREYLAATPGDDQKALKDLKVQVEKCRSDELKKKSIWELELTRIKKLETQTRAVPDLRPGGRAARVCQRQEPTESQAEHLQWGNGPRASDHCVDPRCRRPHASELQDTRAGDQQVKRGQKAWIRVDALPDRELNGVVRSVAPLPDPTDFFARNDVKRHATKVEIEKPPTGIRLGMTAQVEIVVSKLENVLGVPVEAVVRTAGKDQVAVKNSAGTFEWRDVTLGQSNARYVEVKNGIKSGDLVAVEPRALLSEKP